MIISRKFPFELFVSNLEKMVQNNKKYYIETYGCEMNKSDSIDIALSFEKNGYVRTNSEYEADVVILNTCAVRKNAEKRIYGRLGYYRALKRSRGNNTLIVLAGCVAQEKGKEITRIYPEIDIVAGTYHGLDIPQMVAQHSKSTDSLVAVDEKQYQFSEYGKQRSEGHRAWVNIIKGCSNFCSYCIVPFLRGPEVSKSSMKILEEVKALSENGVVEITLLGQNVNAYGKDNDDIDFLKLLEKLNNIDGIQWIRFLTSHPKDFNVEIIKRISSLSKVCKQFHLPVQCGSDRILSLMNRKYSIKHYRTIVESIRTHMPRASITTDIIVGFPTESEDDFNKTIDIVKKFQFDDAFTYRYSERPFTKAAEYENTVASERISKRLEELICLQRAISKKKNQREIGSRTRVLVERQSKQNRKEFLCKTETGKMVVVKTETPIGEFINISISAISGNTLRGVEVEDLY
jgi:tRNA-2-methylthio-N6-dimethylallyladenosine synthase